jgi:hypothetical protein
MHDSAFASRLNNLTGGEITELAASLRVELQTPEGEVCWWRATIAVGSSLKRTHRTRDASLAAHQATIAVQAAALRSPEGHTPARDDITVVARAAAEVARAIVAGLPEGTTAALFAAWEPLVAA